MVEDEIRRRTVLEIMSIPIFGTTVTTPVRRVKGTDMIEVPTVRGGASNEVLKTEQVPKNWLSHVRRPRRVLESKRSDLMSQDGVLSTSLGVSDQKYANMNGSKIVVGVDPETGVEGHIYSEIEGVELDYQDRQTDERPQGTPDLESNTPNYNYDEYPTIGGGVTITGTDDQYFGTTCVAINSANYILTAAHNLTEDFGSVYNCIDVDGEVFHQPWDETVGKVVQTYKNRDVALCDHSHSDRVLSYSIRLEDEDPLATGYHTEDSLEILKSNNESVTNMGVVTGETDAQIIETGLWRDGPGDVCGTFEGSGVVFENSITSPGDSGGPWYTQDGGSVDLIGMHSGGGVYTDGDGVAYGLYDLAEMGYKIGLGYDTISNEN